MSADKPKCPHCGRTLPANIRADCSQWNGQHVDSETARAHAAALGAIGRGASKRRDVDYAALARKAHAKRAANKSKAAGKPS